MKLVPWILAALLGATQLAAADDLPDPYADGAADQAPRPPRARGDRSRQAGGALGPELRQLLVRRFDADGDGRLEGRERRQAARALRRAAKGFGQRAKRKMIERYDLDHDGNLGPGELPPRLQQRLRKMDRNGDGWLDRRDRR